MFDFLLTMKRHHIEFKKKSRWHSNLFIVSVKHFCTFRNTYVKGTTWMKSFSVQIYTNQRTLQRERFFSVGFAPRTVLTASSKTSFIPCLVSALHSKYFKALTSLAKLSP